jgi:hypothetical protein
MIPLVLGLPALFYGRFQCTYDQALLIIHHVHWDTMGGKDKTGASYVPNVEPYKRWFVRHTFHFLDMA